MTAGPSLENILDIRYNGWVNKGVPIKLPGRKTTLTFVTIREGEDGELLLKRFQTSMQRSGILRELRNRRFFRSKGEQTRMDKARSLRRLRRKRTIRSS